MHFCSARLPRWFSRALSAALLIAPLGLSAAFTGYMKIPEIPGESQVLDHEREIDFHGLQWVIDTPSSDVTGARRVGLSQVGDIRVSKYLDASSPYLALACAKGNHFTEVVIKARRDSGDSHLDYLTITLTDVVVTGYSFDSEGDAIPTETLSLNFGAIRFKYVEAGSDGAAGDEHEVEYDIVAGA